MTLATILIPAFNEVAVIERTLLHMSRGMSLADFRIVVIANACTDATAAKARSIMPQAVVIETGKAGKCTALNLGYKEADPDKPVICLDADLDVTAESLTSLIVPILEGTALASCGQMDVRASEASHLVRAYYKGWRTNPYFDRGKFGGLFALSAEAAKTVFPLPEITADDEYIRRSFSIEETAFVKECRFVARAPLGLSSLFKVKCRSLRGAREVQAMGLRKSEGSSVKAVIGRALRQPTGAFSILVYLSVNTAARFVLALWPSGKSGHWGRDLTTRVES
ncbi:MAG: glycosyltransferase [Tateyamaria sp.]|jgi:glycosyltransferase involved in cell wall biosynthesis|uniref:glycosyltransferase n=1 Tax=Tateyamaria sp. TaxID=1929288 RepID=UPI0032DD4011